MRPTGSNPKFGTILLYKSSRKIFLVNIFYFFCQKTGQFRIPFFRKRPFLVLLGKNVLFSFSAKMDFQLLFGKWPFLGFHWKAAFLVLFGVFTDKGFFRVYKAKGSFWGFL